MTLQVPMHAPKLMPEKEVSAPEGSGEISQFIAEHFRHFNARELRDAAIAYKKLIDEGGKMFIAMAGASSTAELGISIAELIRQEKIHAISCTGANLEEGLFDLVAHSKYKQIPHYYMLDPKDEKKILNAGLSRVTDTAIPEQHAMNHISSLFQNQLKQAERMGQRFFPHEYLYQMIRNEELRYEIDPKDCWMLAAEQKNLPIFVFGWSDSTLGNMFAAECIKGTYDDPLLVKGGIETMMSLVDWYKAESEGAGIGFLELGGGISADGPICVVPLIKTDLKEKDCPFWALYIQITAAHSDVGAYSGADPNEKITWEKIDKDTPMFSVHSDFTICFPLLAAFVLGK